MRGSIKEVHCFPFIIGNFVVTDVLSNGLYKVKSYIQPLPRAKVIGYENEEKEYIIRTTKGSTMLKGFKYLIVARLFTPNKSHLYPSNLQFKAYLVVKSKVSNLVHNCFIPSWELIRKETTSEEGEPHCSYYYRTENLSSKFLEVIEVDTPLSENLTEKVDEGYVGCFLSSMYLEGGKVVARRISEDTLGLLDNWCDVIKIKR